MTMEKQNGVIKGCGGLRSMFADLGCQNRTRAFYCVGVQCYLVLGLFAGWGRADDVMATIEALEAGMAQWRESVNFYGTYVKRSAAHTDVEITFEDALAGRVGAAIGRAEDRLEGVVVKLGRFLRASGTWDKPPHVNRPRPSTTIVSRIPFECVGCPEFYFELPNELFPQNLIWVYVRQKEHRGVLRACGTPYMDDPFSFHGGDAHRPISDLFEGDGTNLVKAEATVDGPHLIIRLELKRSRRTVRTLWFSRDYSPPLLVRQEKVTYNDDGSIAMRSETRAENIVAVQGGYMARVLRMAMGPVRDVTGSMTYICSHWVSEDLGRRSPTEDDLAVEIGPEMVIIGLRNAPPPGTKRRFALNQYTLDDLVPAKEGPLIPSWSEPRAPPAPSSKLARWLMMIVGIVALAAVGVLIWWARVRQRAA